MRYSADRLIAQSNTVYFLAAPNQDRDDSTGESYLETAESAIKVLIRPTPRVEVCTPPDDTGARNVLLASGAKLGFRPIGQAPSKRLLEATEALTEKSDEIMAGFVTWSQTRKQGATLTEIVQYFLDRTESWVLGIPRPEGNICWFDLDAGCDIVPAEECFA